MYARYESILSRVTKGRTSRNGMQTLFLLCSSSGRSLFVVIKSFGKTSAWNCLSASQPLLFSVQPTVWAEELAQAGDDKWVDSWLGFLTKNPSSTKDAIKLLRDAFGIAASSQVQSSRPTAAHLHGAPNRAANGDLQPDGAEGPQQHDQTDPIARALKVVSAAPEEVVDDLQEHCGDCGGEGF